MIEIHDWKSVTKKNEKEEREGRWEPEEIPTDVASYLDSFGLL